MAMLTRVRIFEVTRSLLLGVVGLPAPISLELMYAV
jgi:hypothetical protein